MTVRPHGLRPRRSFMLDVGHVTAEREIAMIFCSFYTEYGLFGILLGLWDSAFLQSTVLWELAAALLGLLAGKCLPQKPLSTLLMLSAAAAGAALLLKYLLFGVEEAQMLIPFLGEYLLVGAAAAGLTLHGRRDKALP